MEIKVQYDEQRLKELILRDLQEKLNCDVEMKDIKFEVKTKQNYKAEWENGSFRATFDSYKF